MRITQECNSFGYVVLCFNKCLLAHPILSCGLQCKLVTQDSNHVGTPCMGYSTNIRKVVAQIHHSKEIFISQHDIRVRITIVESTIQKLEDPLFFGLAYYLFIMISATANGSPIIVKIIDFKVHTSTRRSHSHKI